MKEYLEKYLQRNIEIEKYSTDKLPLMFKGIYQIYLLCTDAFEFVVAVPKGQPKLKDLKAHINQLQQFTGKDCAFCFESITQYIADSLLELGIPFVIPSKQIYLPFAGLMLRSSRKKNNMPVQEISFLTQKILLSALYEKWENMNVTQIADAMGVSKTAVSKSFHEIEYLNIPVLDTVGKNHVITINNDIKGVWEEIKPVLRNPVIKRIQLGKDCKLNYKAGISALAEYSMLNDNNYPTYGLLKKNIKKIDITNAVGFGAEIGCEVLELGYNIDYRGNKMMDPLSIVLSLTEKEKADERIQMAIDEMLEEHVW